MYIILSLLHQRPCTAPRPWPGCQSVSSCTSHVYFRSSLSVFESVSQLILVTSWPWSSHSTRSLYFVFLWWLNTSFIWNNRQQLAKTGCTCDRLHAWTI